MSTRTQAADAYAAQLEEKGFGFREIKRRVMAKFGVTTGYNPHDLKDGKAAARRRRQIARGQVPAAATACTCGKMLPPGRDAGSLCDACLAAKWL